MEGTLLGIGFTAAGFGSKRAIPDRASIDPAANPAVEPLPFVLLAT
jgi:hypothetical protein